VPLHRAGRFAALGASAEGFGVRCQRHRFGLSHPGWIKCQAPWRKRRRRPALGAGLCRRTYSSPKVIHKRRKDALLACSEPVVNNFGGLAKWVCKSFTIWLNRRVERAGSGRRIPHSNVMTVLWRFSLRDPASCRKGILRTFRLQVQKMQRRTSISASIRQGLRVQHHNHINPQLL
jgi:hypothetical protein